MSCHVVSEGNAGETRVVVGRSHFLSLFESSAGSGVCVRMTVPSALFSISARLGSGESLGVLYFSVSRAWDRGGLRCEMEQSHLWNVRVGWCRVI